MARRYSLSEAKARFSAMIRQVREGQRVTVTVHGKPVAEIRPVAPAAGDLGSRLAELADRGVLVPPPKATRQINQVGRRPGALARFLAERE